MTNIELYDVGKVLTGPFKVGYAFIDGEGGDKYVEDKAALGRIRSFHKDRSLGIDQPAFTELSKAWVAGIKSGELSVEGLVYNDVIPRFQYVKAQGSDIMLLTSGSDELTQLFIREAYNLVDGLLSGEDIGDKNHPETFAGVWDSLEGNITTFFDDKTEVVTAAVEGFKMAGGNPAIYLVDRADKVPLERVAELESYGVRKIATFDELR